jgi:hypothetical protein
VDINPVSPGYNTYAHKDLTIATIFSRMQWRRDGKIVDEPENGGLFIKGPHNEDIRIVTGEGDICF